MFSKDKFVPGSPELVFAGAIIAWLDDFLQVMPPLFRVRGHVTDQRVGPGSIEVT